MTTEIAQEHYLEKQMEKQIGCMAGFLQIFDRHQLLAGKRIYSAKRLSPAMDSSSESEHSFSPAVSRELGKPQKMKSLPSPDRSVKQSPNYELRSPEVEKPAEIPTKSPLPLPVFEFKEGTRSSWKFSREAPRLSLDSRATVDAKGSLYPREIRTNAAIISGGVEEIEKQRRSTSVIAKLMGLEPPAPEDLPTEKKGELRRSASASESRVSKDFFPSRFVDGNNFHPKLNQSSSFNFPSNAARDGFDRNEPLTTVQSVDSKEYCVPGKEPNRSLGQRKSFFDSHDIFPEPKQNVTVCGEIERRLKMRGIVEASEDLETLKHILEALQLKGLLHSVKSSNRTSNQRNTVHGRRFPGNESPIVLMRPARSPASPNCLSRNYNDSVSSTFTPKGAGRNQSRDRQGIDRNVRNQARTRSLSPATRSEGGVKSPHGGRPLNMETHRKQNISTDQRRLSPVHSPKASPRRTPPAQQPTNRSPRNRKPTAEKAGFVPAEDESSSISESSISTPSQTDTERSKMEYKEGRSLLERCDQLLLSIAEITSPELQPSPVSVLDSSSFYNDESSWSPSPVTKRSIDFKEVPIGFDGEACQLEIQLPLPLLEDDSENREFIYISEIFRVSSYLPVDSDVFIELENQQFLKGKDTSQASRVERKLIFDTITEILDRNRQLPPWKIVSCPNSSNPKPDLQQTWSEFQRIKERDASEDLFEVICGVLRKDLAGDAVTGWGGRPVEMSEAVLDIERLVFKDLIGETIGELAHSGGDYSHVPAALRRKLVF